ncbi:MAG: peptidase S41 [Acidobacteria bacterium]|nr:MAG: peptidase S41 [Acidobacteriota bacterium]
MGTKFNLMTSAILLIMGSFAASAAETPLWMRYPSISPDGTHIAFAYQGNIYTVDANGGRAVLIVANTAYDSRPVWSPDGRHIAFSSDRHGSLDIYLVPSEGGKASRLTFHSATETPSGFSPDGSYVLFSAVIQDTAENAMFPSGVLPELYRVPVMGGRTEQVLTTPALGAVYGPNGDTLYYYDRKGYENIWRKHHTSSVARDIWAYDVKSRTHRKLTNNAGEDRSPVPSADGKSLYYLSEMNRGSFNIYKMDLRSPDKVEQITHFDTHPVRFLSISKTGKLCFGYHGEIYTMLEGQKPVKLHVQIYSDIDTGETRTLPLRDGISEIAVSPDGDEVAFVIRGEIFVTSVKYNTTKRITNTPGQERSVSFSHDGKALLYAAERDGSWNLYQTKKVREEENGFASSTLLKEEAILKNEHETFQAAYSPDDKEVAYLCDRTALKVINLETKKIRTILDGSQSYSYSDGDQWYQWSPDGKYFAVQYSDNHLFRSDLGLIPASGKGELKVLAPSGYSDRRPKWSADGKLIYWHTDRQGLRSHGSWGSQEDVYGLFLTQEAYDTYQLSEEEYAYDKEQKEKEDKKEKKTEEKDSKEEKTKEEHPVVIEWDGLEDRMARLTLHAASVAESLLSKDEQKLYTLTRYEDGFDLWETDLRKKSISKLQKLKGWSHSLCMDQDGKVLFMINGGQIVAYDIAKKKREAISFSAQLESRAFCEYRAYFDHVWRLVNEKWYDPNLHGVDWERYQEAYKPFLKHINNHYDFTEMLSEMLGELNGSHTGSKYRPAKSTGKKTGKLGLFIDWTYKGDGVKIAEIMDKSPLIKEKSRAAAGDIIEAINGKKIDQSVDFWQLMGDTAGKPTLISFLNPKTGNQWQETVKPISGSQENQLLYERWVKRCREQVDKLSNGTIGYTHVRGMDSQSFRKVYSDVMGRNAHKKALIVDTRFNGGGWLHDDLATLLSGFKYVTYQPRGVEMGWDPMTKWTKPSAILVSESNYSDAHAFPYVYQTLKIGPVIGMPVPGTMTAVWWEKLHDPSIVYGIPQVGSVDVNGNYLENQQLEPDIKQENQYEKVRIGVDQQLNKAVEVLLEKVKASSGK